MEGFTLQSSKKPSTKADSEPENDGYSESPFEILCAADEQLNPAIVLAEELMRKDIAGGIDFADIEQAEKTLLRARDEIEKVEKHFAQMVKTPPRPSGRIPIGF